MSIQRKYRGLPLDIAAVRAGETPTFKVETLVVDDESKELVTGRSCDACGASGASLATRCFRTANGEHQKVKKGFYAPVGERAQWADDYLLSDPPKVAVKEYQASVSQSIAESLAALQGDYRHRRFVTKRRRQ
jgi:hypothetical protein